MSNEIITDRFIDNIPDSISWDYQVQSIGMVSDQQAVGLQQILPQLLVLCNIPNLPEPTLDLLAFQFQVLFYNSTFVITDPDERLAAKRQMIANNFDYHAHLGTPAVVQQIVASIYGPAVVQEWFQYPGGTANHFRILLPAVIDTTLSAKIAQLVNVVKRASQAFEGFFLFTAAPNSIYVAVGVFTQIWLFLPMPIALPIGHNYLTIGVSVFAKATVNRSSAVVPISTGMSILPNSRRWAAGAVVCDIRLNRSVTASLRKLAGALAQINLRSTIIDIAAL